MHSSLLVYILGALLLLPQGVFGERILKISSFSTCLTNPDIVLNNVSIEYDQDSGQVTFDVSGTSDKFQNVTATINVMALDKSVYSMDFNPCDAGKFVPELCPVPQGTFSASGKQEIPASFASQVPSVAFSIPDIPATATLQLKSLDTGKDVACIVSDLNNGKSVDSPIVTIVAAGIAAAALLLSGLSALATTAGGGNVAGKASPGFTEVLGWFQGLAMNGMVSVTYPGVYRAFTKNFAFSTGLIPSAMMQKAIDSFRASTGGNLTNNNYTFLQSAMLDFNDATVNLNTSQKRSLDFVLSSRELTTSIGLGGNTTDSSGASSIIHVSGIQAYSEQLSVPGANTFMTMLLIISIVIGAIIVGILLFKLILETWALCGSYPEALRGFREHYWGTMARAIVNLIILLQGIWILYCLFQFTHRDSWGTILLAGVTLGVVIGVLVFYTISIWRTAGRLKKIDGTTSDLYDDKKIWLKYSIFYDSYRKSFWWFFVPGIIYALAKGCILAGLDGHGLAQTIGLLAVETIMLVVLMWYRPYERRSGNIVNIILQVVRVISMVCILIFVNELGVTKTTQTILGFVLVIVQSVFTIIIALLLVINALIVCCKKNPHRQRRKEAEKFRKNREASALEPLVPFYPQNPIHPNSVIMATDPNTRFSYMAESKVPLRYGEVDRGSGYH